jgi:hypothetical protein
MKDKMGFDFRMGEEVWVLDWCVLEWKDEHDGIVGYKPVRGIVEGRDYREYLSKKDGHKEARRYSVLVGVGHMVYDCSEKYPVEDVIFRSKQEAVKKAEEKNSSEGISEEIRVWRKMKGVRDKELKKVMAEKIEGMSSAEVRKVLSIVNRETKKKGDKYGK